MTTVEEKGLPCALQSERLILGAVIQDGEALHDLRPLLTPDDFSTEAYRRIWRRASDMYDAGRAIDTTALFNECQKNRDGIELSFLVDIQDNVPKLPNLHEHARILKDKTLLRKMITTAESIKNRCLEGGEDAQVILDSLGTLSVDLVPASAGGGLQSAGELIDEVGLNTLLTPRKNRGLLFPWPWMDKWTSGMLPAELWVLAGSTSSGKTSAMLQHAVAAARRGVGVAIFSLEVGKASLFQKACYQIARVDSEKLKQGVPMTDEEAMAVRTAANELYDMPLYFDTTSTTVPAIHAAVRRRRAKSRVDHVIVDYLQLLGNTGRHDTRAQAVGANAWALKLLATDFQLPVLLLSQFSRPQKGVVRKPELSDLKESGDIENHANGVWFLHRPDQEDGDMVTVDFMLPKQREGRRNIATDVWFFPKSQRFEEKER